MTPDARSAVVLIAFGVLIAHLAVGLIALLAVAVVVAPLGQVLVARSIPQPVKAASAPRARAKAVA